MNKKQFGPSSAPPAAPIQKTLLFRTSDERLMLGLGSALVLHWDLVADHIQDLIIDQATIILDDAGLPDRQRALETLIRQARAAPLASSK